MDDELISFSTSLPRQLGYSVGHVLNDLCASLWFTYLLVFFTAVLEFSAYQAGVLMIVGQVVDAVSASFVGYYSDHTDNVLSAKYGKRKLWHLFGTVCVLGSFPMVFSSCLGCETTHKWAQMYYYSAFIAVFQIGWAAVQISHLSLIPELADDENTRTHLTALRFGFTVFSNILVYLVTWAVLHITGECSKDQIGPGDVWKFRDIVYIVLPVGIVAVVVFHSSVREKTYQPTHQLLQPTNNHIAFLRSPTLYHVAGVYMSTRLAVNVSQVLVPMYLHVSLKLPARALAVVPLALYLGGLAAAGAQRAASHRLSRKAHYLAGAALVCAACVAGVYMSTRLAVNVSQVLVPMYLHVSLKLPARALAVVPLALYLGGLAAAGAQRAASHRLSRKAHYLAGAALVCAACAGVYCGRSDDYKVYYIYAVAAAIGFGGAVMLVTSLALMADLVGGRTDASAFVYGLMSFTDKLSCGIAILLIQIYAEGSSSTYYRDTLAFACGAASLLGLLCTLTLPRLAPAPLDDSTSINADENSPLLNSTNA